MSIHPFGVEVSAGTVRVSGEIDIAVAAQLLDAILAFGTSQDRQSLRLDLAGVTFMGSSGLSALIEARKRLEARGCRLLLENVPPKVARVIEATGLSGHLGVPPTNSPAAN